MQENTCCEASWWIMVSVNELSCGVNRMTANHDINTIHTQNTDNRTAAHTRTLNVTQDVTPTTKQHHTWAETGLERVLVSLFRLRMAVSAFSTTSIPDDAVTGMLPMYLHANVCASNKRHQKVVITFMSDISS